MKILIVDDNCQMREMMQIYLRDLADEIRECCDGTDALAAYTNFQPDWVLMDWEMKQMDGLTATRQIVSSYPEAQILIFTQYDDDELRATARETGARGFVLKDELQMLRTFLTRQQPAPAV